MSRRVLVVDDDPDIMFMATITLQQAGFEVLPAPTGEAALESLARDRPDAVVLDLRLPGIDGWAVLDSIRANPELRGTPVIIVSAHASGHAAAEAALRGATAYVTKPFHPQSLVNTLTAAFAAAG